MRLPKNLQINVKKLVSAVSILINKMELNSKSKATNENWTGKIFGNNWEILEKLSCAQYREVYQNMTGDTTKQIKNVHYLVRNNNCGIETYMERTVIDRALRNNTTVMSKCRGCINGSNFKSCHYSTMCRKKPLYKIPNRESKIKQDETYGLFYVMSIEPSSNYQDHQSRAKVKCTLCGREQISRFDTLLERTLACECFREHSSGEKLIENYLQKHNYLYESEKTFNDLTGTKGGLLRYDFVIYGNDKQIKALLEFDGQGHYKAIEHWGGEEALRERQEYDIIKDNYAKNHNIPLLRINYKDVSKIDNIISKFLENNKI